MSPSAGTCHGDWEFLDPSYSLSFVWCSAKHEPENHAIVWRIRKFQGKLERMLDAEIEMMKSTKEKAWSRPPIQIEFQVPMFTSSGLHVRFLKVFEKSSYPTTKWVRYVTRAGQYQLRI